MMSPIKSLFASNRLGHLSGMLLPALGISSAAASLLQPGAPAKLGGFAQSLVSPDLACVSTEGGSSHRHQHASQPCEIILAVTCAGQEGETGEPITAAEVGLRHCLSARARRWAAAEFFCSAIDRPYFMRSELQVLHRRCMHLTQSAAAVLTPQRQFSTAPSIGGKRRF
jgi:hypothetical protein